MRKHLLWILPTLLLITGCNSRLDDHQQFQFRRVSYLLKEHCTDWKFSFRHNGNGYTYTFTRNYYLKNLTLEIFKDNEQYLSISASEQKVNLYSSSPNCDNDPITFPTKWLKIDSYEVFTHALNQVFHRLIKVEDEYEAKKQEYKQLFADAHFVLGKRETVELQKKNLYKYRYYDPRQKIEVTIQSSDGSSCVLRGLRFFRDYDCHILFDGIQITTSKGDTFPINLLASEHREDFETLFVDALKLLQSVAIKIRKEIDEQRKKIEEKARKEKEEKEKQARQAKQLIDKTIAQFLSQKD